MCVSVCMYSYTKELSNSQKKSKRTNCAEEKSAEYFKLELKRMLTIINEGQLWNVFTEWLLFPVWVFLVYRVLVYYKLECNKLAENFSDSEWVWALLCDKDDFMTSCFYKQCLFSNIRIYVYFTEMYIVHAVHAVRTTELNKVINFEQCLYCVYLKMDLFAFDLCWLIS